MNTATPIVTTARTVMQEVCGDAAHYFEKRNAESLQLAMQELLNNESLCKQLVQKGKERALRFRKEKTIHQLVEIYSSL